MAVLGRRVSEEPSARSAPATLGSSAVRARYHADMATPRKRQPRGGEDPAWAEPVIGSDPNAPRKMPGERVDSGRTNRIAEAFWRECDTIPLSIPRWGNRPRMNKNITFMLKTHDEAIVKASFLYFRAESNSLNLDAAEGCWEVYFRRRGSYVRSAERAMEGRRVGEGVRKAGDIVVDNQRFQGRSPGDATDTDDPYGDTDDVS